jgi:hypothetical protein
VKMAASFCVGSGSVVKMAVSFCVGSGSAVKMAVSFCMGSGSVVKMAVSSAKMLRTALSDWGRSAVCNVYRNGPVCFLGELPRALGVRTMFCC